MVDEDCPGDLPLGDRGKNFEKYASRAAARDAEEDGCLGPF